MRFFGQSEKPLPDGAQQDGLIAAGKIRPPDGAEEERVSGKHGLFRGIIQGNAAGRVAGGFQNRKLQGPEVVFPYGNILAGVGGNRRQAPDAAAHGFRIVQTGIMPGGVDRRARGRRKFGHAVGVVEMLVRQADGKQLQAALLEVVPDGRGIAARINDDGLRIVADDIAVGFQRAEGKFGNGHRASFADVFGRIRRPPRNGKRRDGPAAGSDDPASSACAGGMPLCRS